MQVYSKGWGPSQGVPKPWADKLSQLVGGCWEGLEGVFIFILNLNLYTVHVLQRYRGSHVLSTYYAHACVVGCMSQMGLTMGGDRVEVGGGWFVIMQRLSCLSK